MQIQDCTKQSDAFYFCITELSRSPFISNVNSPYVSRAHTTRPKFISRKPEAAPLKGRCVCTRVYRPWATHTGCTAHFVGRDFLRHNEKWAEARGGKGKERGTRTLHNGVWRQMVRTELLSALCLSEAGRARCSEWTVPCITERKVRGGSALSIDLVARLSRFFFPLASFAALCRRTQVESTTAARGPIHEIYRGNRSVTLQREQAMRQWLCRTVHVRTHDTSVVSHARPHNNLSSSEKTIYRLTVLSKISSTPNMRHAIKSLKLLFIVLHPSIIW